MAKLNVCGDSHDAQMSFLASRRLGGKTTPQQHDLCEGRGKNARASKHVGTPKFGPVPEYSLT